MQLTNCYMKASNQQKFKDIAKQNIFYLAISLNFELFTDIKSNITNKDNNLYLDLQLKKYIAFDVVKVINVLYKRMRAVKCVITTINGT